MIAGLPKEITDHLPSGYEPEPGVWLVLTAMDGGARDGIETVNAWLHAEDWYPPSLEHIVWFGDDGVGNFLGWDPQRMVAVLWNPEDGDDVQKTGQIREVWQFVLNRYKDAT